MVVGGALGLGVFFSPLVLTPKSRLLPNVRLQGLEVGGCEAGVVRAYLAECLTPARMWLATPERTWTFSLAEVGGTVLIEKAVNDALALRNHGPLPDRAKRSWDAILHGCDLPVRVSWDRGKLGGQIRKVAWVTNKPALDATLRRENGVFLVTASQPGRQMDLVATLARLTREYRVDDRRIEALYRPLSPRVHENDLRCDLGLLAEFATRFPARKQNRTANLKLALSRLRGAVILPGEVFSFNRVVGERTRRGGYRIADIFVDHEVVPGVGGGVCQVSTTLYGAIRRAKFKVVERHKHSLPVPYVPVGHDATVSYPHRDLKFINNTPNPVYVEGWVAGSRLTVQLWGKRDAPATGTGRAHPA
jgi:vancomycin resistance protein YoaR